MYESTFTEVWWKLACCLCDVSQNLPGIDSYFLSQTKEGKECIEMEEFRFPS
jgi:hypothetical protein